MNEIFRQEKKYLLSFEQFRHLDHLLSQTLPPDKYNEREGYCIRSLYFDTMHDRDFYEKEDGLEVRRKLRLRIYDPKQDFAMLEMKQKQGKYQKKRSLRLNRKDAIELTKGRYEVLKHYEEKFAWECYGMMQLHCYRPKAIVEYQRKAYAAAENKTRITLDFNLIGTECSYDIFSTELNQYPVFHKNLAVLEVKYSGFLLSYIKDLLAMEGKSETSVSKYCLSRTAGLHYKF